MNLSARERRLVIVLGVVVLVMVTVYLLGRSTDGPVEISGGPPPVATSTQPVATPTIPSTPPVFVIPPGARDPFGKG